MRHKTAAVALAALLGGAGLAVAPTASAASSGYCSWTYTSSEPQLSYGDSGVAVQALQCQLNADMRDTHLVVDGKFGGLTYNAVVKFQGCAHLAKDGIVGPNTWRELNAHITDTSSDYVC